MLSGLFSAAVVTCETDYPAEFAPLSPEEALHTGSMCERRLSEFRAGRYCARQALVALGVGALPVARGADRAPVWPEGVTGSITHVCRGESGLAAAAVARTTDVRALGLDAELDVPLDEDLLPIVLTPRERAAFAHATLQEREFLGKLSFSAKEAVYKCQYTLTRQFLEFTDLELYVDLATSSFRATFLRAAGAFGAGSSLQGRFARQRGWIVTSVQLAT
ncbi:MAG TPA: 4'-phosphopantetheinyl transferase superfamily protein [Polyangiaceae bacterium]